MKQRSLKLAWRRFTREESGVALVEFGLSALVLITVVIGVMGFALAMYAIHFVSYAAQQGARFAMVRGYTWSKNTATGCSTSAPPNFTLAYDCTASATDIQNYVQSLATTGVVPANVTINTTSSYLWPGVTPDGTTTPCTQANSKGCLVKVTVNYTFTFLPLQGLSNLSLTATSEGAILQ